MTRLYRAALAHFAGDPPPTLQQVQSDFLDRWEAMLGPLEGRVAEFNSARLDWSRFEAPGPGWPGARHHCPDILSNQDGSLLVLGELHAGINSLATLSARLQHPQPVDLDELHRQDFKGVHIAPVPNEVFTRCLQDSCLATEDIHLETLDDACSWRPAAQRLRIGDLQVQRTSQGRLRASTLDGLRSFDIIEIFERFLKLNCAVHFSLCPRGQHVPRIVLDHLVVVRETWRFGPGDLDFVHAKDPSQRFLQAHRWRERFGLPRRVFARVPTEVKPILVDFHSSLLIETLCRQTRHSMQLKVSEMLPDLESAWLPDKEGQRYTSEFRFVAVDPKS